MSIILNHHILFVNTQNIFFILAQIQVCDLVLVIIIEDRSIRLLPRWHITLLRPDSD